MLKSIGTYKTNEQLFAKEQLQDYELLIGCQSKVRDGCPENLINISGKEKRQPWDRCKFGGDETIKEWPKDVGRTYGNLLMKVVLYALGRIFYEGR